MTKILPKLPWHILIPIVFLFGLSMTLWGGVHLLRTAYDTWTQQVSSAAHKGGEHLRGEWMSLSGDVMGLLYLFTGSERVEEHEFKLVAQKVTSRHNSVLQLHFIPQNSDNAMLSYSLPQFEETPSGETFRYLEQLAQTYHKAVQPPRSLSVKGPSLSLRNNVGELSTLAYVVPLSQISTPGLLVAFFDPRSFMNIGMTQYWDQRIAARMSYHGAQELPGFEPAKSVFSSQPNLPDIAEADFSLTQEMEVRGQRLSLDWHFYVTPEFGPNWFPALSLFALGCFLTMAFGWVVWSQQMMSNNIRRQVVERTHQLEQASRRFRLITDNAYDLIAITNRDFTVDYLNSAYHRVLGYGREELRQQPLLQYVHPRDVEAVHKSLNEVLSGRHAAETTFRMRHKNGSWLYMEGVAKGLHDSNWQLNNIVIHCRDITSRKKYADELGQSEQRFRDFADSSADWLWEVDENLQFSYVSPGVKNTLGYSPDEMMNSMHLDNLFERKRDTTRELIESRIQRQQPYRDVEFWTRAKSGDRVCLRMSGVPVFDTKQRFVGYRGAATNITASKATQERMYYLATTDSLTNLLNRHRFMEELERSVNLSKRHKTLGALAIIDLDRFKEINDTHGHDAGDAILREVGNILRKSVRNTDIVARMGGDEFAIIMHNITLERAREKALRIVEELANLRTEYKGFRLQTTMSMGMVMYPQEDKNPEELYMGADLAMYRAKDMGRNRLYVDDAGDGEQTRDSVREQLRWVGILRKALAEDNFELFYQPIIPAKKHVRPLVECLLRIRDEDGNIGSPAIYIDAAEHFGLIQQLDISVLNRAIKTQVELAKRNVHVDMTVNLSSHSIGDKEVIKELHDVVKRYDFEPGRIVLEVTETAALHNPSAYRDLSEIRHFIAELRRLGFRFAIDDFGSGFSSFSYLRALDLDIIKIDGSFIKDLDKSKTDQLFVQSIADLAHGLGIQVVAEFIENDKITQKVLDFGIEYGQGWHLGKPAPDLEEITAQITGKTMQEFIPEPTAEAAKSKPKVVKAAKAKPVKKAAAKTAKKPAKKAKTA